MKPSSKRALGVAIIALSVLAMAIGVCQVMPYAFVDFPCFDDEVRSQEINSDTRIVYCISIFPLEALSGGGIYDDGSSNQDEIAVGEISLKRDDQTLFVNNHALNVSEIYKTTKWNPSINPWVLFTRHFEIKNEGLLIPNESPTPIDVLYVSGYVYEGWFINPLGLVILVYGILLFRQGKKELQQESLSKSKVG